jgi:hypothetical protein
MLRVGFFLAVRDFGSGLAASGCSVWTDAAAAFAVLAPESAAEGDGKSAPAVPVVSAVVRAISAAAGAIMGDCDIGLREEDACAAVDAISSSPANEAPSGSPASCRYTLCSETAVSPHKTAATPKRAPG